MPEGQQLDIETWDVPGIDKCITDLNEDQKALLNRFKRIIALQSIAWCDKEIFEYLKNDYLFCSQEMTYEEFRTNFWGIEGYRKFIVHFIRPKANWKSQHKEINNEIHRYVIDNIGAILKNSK